MLHAKFMKKRKDARKTNENQIKIRERKIQTGTEATIIKKEEEQRHKQQQQETHQEQQQQLK